MKRVAEAYSKALFNLSDQYVFVPELIPFLNSPVIPDQEKLSIFDKDEKLKRFFSLLLENGRTKDFPEIIEEYKRRVLESKNILEVEVSSADPLDSMELQKIKEKFEGFYKMKVKITEKIDPQIIGGAILTIGNKMIDYSINGRLEKLRKDLCK